MGCHRKQSRTRIARRLPIVAAPALAGVAATFCMAPQALADPSTAQGTARPAVTADAAHRLGPSSAQLLSAIDRAEQASQQQASQQQASQQQASQQQASQQQASQQQASQQQASQQQAGSSQPSTYTVKAGDSLSSIAGRAYHSSDAWPVLYWANRSKIHWANVIQPGQVLRIPVKPAKIPTAPGQLGPAPAPVAQTAAAQTPTYTQSTAPVSSAGAGGSFQQCVIARESGGNSQVMNGTGHYGLYQFSASTWAAYGGNPADFGNASVSEQNTVFNNAIAQGGQSNWSAYDGC